MELYERNSSNIFMNIIKGISISIIFTLIALLIYSCLLVYTDINENTENIVIITVTGISILIGSSIGNKKTNKNGILNGGLIGGIYIFLIYIISSLCGNDFSLNMSSIIMIIVSMITGMIGGIIGVNTKK